MRRLLSDPRGSTPDFRCHTSTPVSRNTDMNEESLEKQGQVPLAAGKVFAKENTIGRYYRWYNKANEKKLRSQMMQENYWQKLHLKVLIIVRLSETFLSLKVYLV